MNSIVLPPPTPQDIEAALTDIRDGTNVYGRWVRFSNDLKNQDESNAEADRLWWVDIIDPDGVAQDSCGGGITSAEATAVAWINTYLLAWWLEAKLSDKDYSQVPRQVPEGWQFVLYSAPVRVCTEGHCGRGLNGRTT